MLTQEKHQTAKPLIIKEVTRIAIQSPFIPCDIAGIIKMPTNIPIDTLLSLGVIHYRNAPSTYIPIDGEKLALSGIDGHAPGEPGDTSWMILSYKLALDERKSKELPGDYTQVTRTYTLTQAAPDEVYKVSLYVFPEWNHLKREYKLRFYFVNLSKNDLRDVTDLVELDKNSPAFNPTKYMRTQRLTYTLNLQKVSGLYQYLVHKQSFAVRLMDDPSTTVTTPWLVSTRKSTTEKPYGGSIMALLVPSTKNRVTIANGCGNVCEWLNCTYIRTLPNEKIITNNCGNLAHWLNCTYIRAMESLSLSHDLCPMPPTHLEVRHGVESIIKPIKDYNSVFEFVRPVPLYDNVEVVFLKETCDGFHRLAIVCMTVR